MWAFTRSIRCPLPLAKVRVLSPVCALGCVAAKGLCFALDIPLIALPTLQILATPHSKNSMVVSLLDARRDEVYAAVYNKAGTLKGETHAHILTASSFADLAANQVSFVGTGAEKTKDLLPSNPNWKFVSSHPSATAMPALAFKAFEKKAICKHPQLCSSLFKTPLESQHLKKMHWGGLRRYL